MKTLFIFRNKQTSAKTQGPALGGVSTWPLGKAKFASGCLDNYLVFFTPFPFHLNSCMA